MKAGIFVGSVILGAVLATSAFAKEPCASELCLSGREKAREQAMCKQPADDFFSIKKKSGGAFDPVKTYKARRDYLYSCESGNTADKEAILAAYGAVVKW